MDIDTASDLSSKSRFRLKVILAEIEQDPELTTISDWLLAYERKLCLQNEGKAPTNDDLFSSLALRWMVMEKAIQRGTEQPLAHKMTLPGMKQGMAYLYATSPMRGRLTGKVGVGIGAALALAEGNISGVQICALPTAGACAVVGPAIQVAIEEFKPDHEQILRGLATALTIEAVFVNIASVSGAKHGCQAEIGAAAAMAAAAVTEIVSGDPRQVSHAVAIALQTFLGLVCDPIGGFVICPCIFRNTTATAVALSAAELACAGVEFPIPADEVIMTMGQIGADLPTKYRETGKGGLAATATGKALGKSATAQYSQPRRPPKSS